MGAEALHLIAHLGVDHLQELRRRRVLRAGEHHVLPDEQAELVAEIVEIVELVEAAAPDADHVHVGGDRLGEEAPDALAGDARGQRVGRDPVGALGEDVDAVDAEIHRHARFIGLGDQLELAQPDLLLDLVAGDRDDRIVERLRAVARRPPERRAEDLERKRRRGAPGARHLDLGRYGLGAEGEGHRHLAAADCGQLDVGRDRHHPALVVALADDHVLDARAVEEMQLRLGIDAEHHQAQAPVPAGVALGLADHVEVGDAVVADAPRDGEGLARRPRMSLGRSRTEADGDLVVAGPERIADVQAMADEGRAEFAHGEAVDRHVGEGVDEFEVEDRPFARDRRRLEREAPADFPIRVADPLHLGLVPPDHRVGDAAGGDQRRVDIPRNRARADRCTDAVMQDPGSGEGNGHQRASWRTVAAGATNGRSGRWNGGRLGRRAEM